jgi:hypothetical protein
MMESEGSPLSENDIQEAREFLENILSGQSKRRKGTHSNKTVCEIENHVDHMIVRLKNGHEIHGQKIVKMKTVFHSVEVDVEDRYGGVLNCTYNIKNTISGLHGWLQDKYPPATVNDIQRIADEEGISFDLAKRRLALTIAEAEIRIRIEMARFLHEQLKPTLQIVLSDLVEDAAMYGLSLYGCKLDKADDFDQVTKSYAQYRKKRANIIRSIGDRGKARVSSEEVDEFIRSVLRTMGELKDSGRRITNNAVARKIIGSTHTNPLKAFKDKLKKYGLTFEGLKEEFELSKS